MEPEPARKEFVILTVEAGETALSSRKLLMESAGFNVISAIAASQAIRFAEKYNFHAVMFDLDVTDMPLKDFIQKIRQLYPDIPFYVVAHAHWVPPTPEIRAEVSGVFEKMADPKKIIDELVRALPVNSGTLPRAV